MKEARTPYIMLCLCAGVYLISCQLDPRNNGGSNGGENPFSDKEWGTAEIIETDDSADAWNPQVGVDGNGNAVAVWYQFDGTRLDVWSNRYVAGVGWRTAQLIETENIGSAQSPQVAVDGNGSAVAVWCQSDGAGFDHIWSSRYVAGIGWILPQFIEEEGIEPLDPQVGIDGLGNAVSVWQESDGIRYSLYSGRYIAGIGWGTAQLIETDDSGDAANQQIRVDRSGNAIAVWQQHDGTRNNIWSSYYIAGIGWILPQLIETDNSGDAARPEIDLDGSGNAVAVWNQSDGARDSIWSNRYIVGSGWGTAQLIETDDSVDASYAEVAVDESGNAVVVWLQWDGIRGDLWSNRYVVGSGWGTAELIETDDSGSTGSAEVGVDGNGNAVAVWYQSDGTRFSIWSNCYVVGSGWGTAELIETDDTGNAGIAQIAVDGSGNAVAVWYQSDGTRDSIWSNTRR